MVICLGQGADLHMAQLMPRPSLSLAPVNPDWFYLPGSTFLVSAHPSSPGQKSNGAVKRLCVLCVLQGEHIMFKDRKLNIGPAVRKQVRHVCYFPAICASHFVCFP